MRNALHSRAVPAQALLIPEIVDLPEDDCDRLVAHADEFARLGLGIERFGPGAIAVRETPAMLGEMDASGLIRQLADELAEWDTASGLKAKLDCKGAVLEGRLAVPFEDAMTRLGMAVESPSEPGKSARPVVAAGAPRIEGAGELQRLALPGQVNRLAASPDGSHVLVDRALESDVVLDAELRVVGKARETGSHMCFLPDGCKLLRKITVNFLSCDSDLD